MKPCTPALRDHLAAETTRLATLWRITRRDGVVMGYTDHDADIAHGGLTYKAASGFTPGSVASAAGPAVDDLEVQSVLDADDIAEDDLLNGVYDGALVEIMLVDHADPDRGMLPLRKGRLGEVRVSGQVFVAEVRGMTEAFSRNLGQLYSPICRGDLGDGRCRIGIAAHSVTGTVTGVTDRRSFADSGRDEAAGWFDHGLLTWTEGANAGLAMEVKSFADGAFALFLPMRHDIAIGDQFRVRAGCDKRFETCRDKFGNALNFQGEPHVPGFDFLWEAAGR